LIAPTKIRSRRRPGPIDQLLLHRQAWIPAFAGIYFCVGIQRDSAAVIALTSGFMK